MDKILNQKMETKKEKLNGKTIENSNKKWKETIWK